MNPVRPDAAVQYVDVSNKGQTMRADFGQIDWDATLEDDCRQLVRLAIREDLDRSMDWTTVSLVPAGARGEARVTSRDAGVICGLRAAALAIDEMQAELIWQPHVTDGTWVTPGDCVATISGSARDLLTAERTLLNFVGRLSGVATLTQQYVACVEGTAARVYDTRKTTPGWRRLEKYAVASGGGRNHRVGLFAAVMIKDNHLAFSGEQGLRPADAVSRTRAFLASTEVSPHALLIEVEVDTFAQFQDVLPARPDVVLLDNMGVDLLSQCVSYRNTEAPDVELEASGGVSLQTIAAIAQTGVDRISVGALTHSAVNFDVGLDWR